MVINFLGDSITEGAMAGDEAHIYLNQVGRILGAEVHNFGVSGTRFAKQKITHYSPSFDEDFLTRAKKMGNADVVCVFGGTNDFGHGDAALGDFSSRDPYTFYGALHCLCSYLIEKYDKEKIFFILPLRRYDEDSVHGEFYTCKKGVWPVLEDYTKIIQEVVSSYGIKILDLREKMGKPSTNQMEDMYYDGLHPNQKGHTVLAELVAEYIERTFVK